ncbi:hypothetical protein SPBR_05695 [Sporothrix brasiliensis 5110]|uniref:CUE domain-containing protein n=1 Tax=Sporothrix brasiliensis 5110 TaxID=1398154 RepID=A0A0C2J4B7_9PEZI|nr:uncharacterized protein SPBR_05695 [Sporothrix brasiliensis 5110]KIH93865.1 hypothetical protein SPBR_05695 [Sporothrix brasiliensis 5110]
MDSALPPFAPFPDSAARRQQIGPDDWALYLASWRALTAAYLALPDAKFAAALAKDEQTGVSSFLVSFARALAESGPAALAPFSPPPSPAQEETATSLKKTVFLLTARALRLPKPPPAALLAWEHLADLSRVYGRRRTGHVLGTLPPASVGAAEASLSALKKFLIRNMEDGPSGKGDTRAVEARLLRVNYLVSAWPAAGALLLTGSDYLDALCACFVIMNPPLRRAIVTNLYVCLIGLTEPPTPRYSLLSDLLYAVRGAAEEHKKGPLRPSDSLAAELVSVTPLLQQIRQRAEAPSSSGATGAGTSTNRILPILEDLVKFRKPGSGLSLPPGRLKRKINKGKAAAQTSAPTAAATDTAATQQLHPHKLSQIAVVQDLFPDLGSAFVAKLLDAYDDDTEQVVAHLLEGTLPAHLDSADRSENLRDAATTIDSQHAATAMAPRATPPLPPARRNIFDGDELDELSLQTSKLHFGKSAASTTADDLLADGSSAKAPNKAAIWSALAAFDSDDDERDDTYDAADVGGTVDASAPGGTTGADGDDLHAANDQTLYAAYMATPNAAVFQRDAATRRSAARARLRDETGMTDEAIEGWAVMLARNPQQRRRLELQSSAFGGEQTQLARTSWRASDQDDDNDDGEAPSRGGYRGGHRGGGRGRGGGSGRGRGNVAGPTGDKDTQQARNRKEANKGSRANHNRRDQRAKKMARGGFPG